MSGIQVLELLQKQRREPLNTRSIRLGTRIGLAGRLYLSTFPYAETRKRLPIPLCFLCFLLQNARRGQQYPLHFLCIPYASMQRRLPIPLYFLYSPTQIHEKACRTRVFKHISITRKRLPIPWYFLCFLLQNARRGQQYPLHVLCLPYASMQKRRPIPLYFLCPPMQIHEKACRTRVFNHISVC